MNKLEKQCYIKVLRSRYRRISKKAKGEILDELCLRLKCTRKHGIRLLSAQPTGRPRKGVRRGRPSKYSDPEFVGALRFVWRKMRYMCSKLLKEAMPEWLPYIEQERNVVFPEEIRERLLCVSAPTIDRILKPYKYQKGKSFTRSTGFRDQIPIQENIWDIQIPGFMESDTVAHCGGSMHGEFVNTLTMVDIATLWTEVRAVFGRGSNPVFYALKHIESLLPFPIKGYDADNGGEVLNKHILSYFQDERVAQNREPVQVTRARAYKKNDNAHVEQRNDSIARRYLGYERFDFSQIVPLINFYYVEIVAPLQNHFFPVFKLQGKLRVKSRTRRIYGKPITPYQRVLNSEHISEQYKDILTQWHSQLNPIILTNAEFKVRKMIDTAAKKLRKAQPVDIHKMLLSARDSTFQQHQNAVSPRQLFRPLNHFHDKNSHNLW